MRSSPKLSVLLSNPLRAALALACCTLPAAAQLAPSLPAPAAVAVALPDSPGATLVQPALTSSSSSHADLEEALDSDPQQPTVPGKPLPLHPSPSELTIAAGQVAPKQTVHDKLVGSLRDTISPFSLSGELISAGYSHVTNGTPNYGTDSAAFAQRVGASVARGTSQNLFYEGAMASILHEDPRYYQLGSQANFFKRVVYAGTRPIITRTDGGRSTPNFALLSGYLGAAALTKVYYPQPNQGFRETLITYGGSIGGASIGYLVTEFLPGFLETLHLKKLE